MQNIIKVKSLPFTPYNVSVNMAVEEAQLDPKADRTHFRQVLLHTVKNYVWSCHEFKVFKTLCMLSAYYEIYQQAC